MLSVHLYTLETRKRSFYIHPPYPKLIILEGKYYKQFGDHQYPDSYKELAPDEWLSLDMALPRRGKTIS